MKSLTMPYTYFITLSISIYINAMEINQDTHTFEGTHIFNKGINQYNNVTLHTAENQIAKVRIADDGSIIFRNYEDNLIELPKASDDQINKKPCVYYDQETTYVNPKKLTPYALYEHILLCPNETAEIIKFFNRRKNTVGIFYQGMPQKNTIDFLSAPPDISPVVFGICPSAVYIWDLPKATLQNLIRPQSTIPNNITAADLTYDNNIAIGTNSASIYLYDIRQSEQCQIKHNIRTDSMYGDYLARQEFTKIISISSQKKSQDLAIALDDGHILILDPRNQQTKLLLRTSLRLKAIKNESDYLITQEDIVKIYDKDTKQWLMSLPHDNSSDITVTDICVGKYGAIATIEKQSTEIHHEKPIYKLQSWIQ